MPYILYRPTPIDNWRVYATHQDPPEDGEIIDLPDCHFYSQAQAEADRLNGRGDARQESLPL